MNTANELKKSWSGNYRLAIDIFCCLLLGILMQILGGGFRSRGIADTIGVLYGCVIWIFFLFFFWSWTKEHIECAIPRRVIHVFCWTFLVFCFVILGRIPYQLYLSLNLDWLPLVIGIWMLFVAKKYYKLIY